MVRTVGTEHAELRYRNEGWAWSGHYLAAYDGPWVGLGMRGDRSALSRRLVSLLDNVAVRLARSWAFVPAVAD
jgi:hypothetical protein